MRAILPILGVTGIVLGLALTCKSSDQIQTVVVPSTPTPLIDPVADLRQHVERSVSLSDPKLSSVRKKLITSLMVDVATKVFETREQQRYWTALVGVESAYNGAARSKTGAIGLGQLIPSYRKDFGKACGLTDVDATDLTDDYTNAYLSACYFRDLIEQNGGNIPLAMVAYTAGSASPDYKAAKHGGAISPSSTAYVTRISIKKAAAEGK